MSWYGEKHGQLHSPFQLPGLDLVTWTFGREHWKCVFCLGYMRTAIMTLPLSPRSLMMVYMILNLLFALYIMV